MVKSYFCWITALHLHRLNNVPVDISVLAVPSTVVTFTEEYLLQRSFTFLTIPRCLTISEGQLTPFTISFEFCQILYHILKKKSDFTPRRIVRIGMTC